MPPPLSSLRVLDLSRVLAGPWATQILADMGAEVIKVERPDGGDDTRGWGPPYLRDADGHETGESAYFLCANRGKRSLALDLADPRGRAIAQDLAARADVVVENFKVGGAARLGLDYETLKADNPGLVYCAITGFGQTGPEAERAGYDAMIQARGGLMSLTGDPSGQPQKVGVALVDVLTGLYATIAILGALAHRDRTGEGQQIDMALLDVLVASLANQSLNCLVSGQAPQRLGNAHPNIVPYETFATQDGHIMLAVGNDAQFARFCRLAGRNDLATDHRFATNSGRVAHRAILVPIVADLMARRPTAVWLKTLEAEGIPCGPINDLAAVFADPQVIARGLELSLPHPLAGQAPGVASPLRFSQSPVAEGQAPPLLGQHSRAVLREDLGLSDATIDTLVTAGVVAEAPMPDPESALR